VANYVKSTNFAVKDGLPSGDPLKVVKGTEIDTEFNNIATSVQSKADLSSPTFLGTPFAPTAATATNTNQIATTAYVKAQKDAEATLTNKTLVTPKVDVINEATADAGVTVDGVLLKDGSIASSALGSGTADRTTFLRGDRTWAFGVVGSGFQLFTESGTFTVPIDVTKLKVTVVSGGGGGGGAATSNRGGNGGGSGAMAVAYIVDMTPEEELTVTVGAGGEGGVGSAAGTAGGASSFSDIVSCTGGAAGLSNRASSGTAAAGGTATTAFYIQNGEAGGLTGFDDENFYGGTGGALEQYTINSVGGAGRVATNGNGSPGQFYGAGGGGAYRSTSGTSTGGAGTGGFVLVEW
jgi:hypothetical protein